jgi:hypothetical protein
MTFATIAMTQLLTDIHARYAPSAPRAYADDMPQVCACLSQAALARGMQPAALRIAAELARAGLTMPS